MLRPVTISQEVIMILTRNLRVKIMITSCEIVVDTREHLWGWTNSGSGNGFAIRQQVIVWANAERFSK